MKVLGRWSLASVMKVLIDVPYFALLVILPLVGTLTLWAVLSARSGGRTDKFQIQVPVRFELEEARHPFILILLAEVFRLGSEMKGDLETARKIQFDLVPGEAFRRSDVVIQARMRPARSVGGDLYDIIDLAEGSRPSTATSARTARAGAS